MKAILDTHTFLWWITNDQRISQKVFDIISDGENELYLSTASGWEISIKYALGSLKLPAKPDKFVSEQIAANSIITLPIQMNHALYVYTLPHHHRDPFDRMIITQAQLEKLAVITADKEFEKYKIKTIW